MKRIIGVFLLLITIFSFNVVNAERLEIENYEISIIDSYDNNGFNVTELFKVNNADQNSVFIKYISKDSSNIRLNREYKVNNSDNYYIYEINALDGIVRDNDLIELNYNVNNSDSSYYYLNFLPIKAKDDNNLVYKNISIIIHTSNPELNSENFIFDPDTYVVETGDNQIKATMSGELTEVPGFSYKVKIEDSSNEENAISNNPLAKYRTVFFVSVVILFITYLGMYMYCKINRDFQKYFMFTLYFLSEITFMLYCSSLGGLAFIILHIFYSFFFIGFLIAKQNKPDRLNAFSIIFLLLHSSAFLISGPLVEAITLGTIHVIGVVAASAMFYVTLFSFSYMYNHGDPMPNYKIALLPPKNKKKVIRSRYTNSEMYKSTVFYQFSKEDSRSNYSAYLKNTPNEWFYFHHKSIADGLFLWYIALIIAFFVILPVGYIFGLHILYDVMKINNSIVYDVIAFIIPFSFVMVVTFIIVSQHLKRKAFADLYKNGAIIKDLPCTITEFKIVHDDLGGYYSYRISCKYSVFDEEKTFTSELKRDYVYSYPKTCDMLIDLENPKNYYIDFAINREE